jgi:hypothetical protein
LSGSGGQVRYQLDPTNNQTLVEADLAGDSAPDLEIRLSGLVNLSAADSSADMAAGAALQVSQTARYGNATVESYTDVTGKSHTSYQAFYTSPAVDVADDLNLSSTANELDLWGCNLTISRGSGTESLQAGSTIFPLAHHASSDGVSGFTIADSFGDRLDLPGVTSSMLLANPGNISFV